ncbi:hypothetical protein AJ79_09800 [Helicocarpus griseus UAMH5409]|uniref:Histone deacetylase complex subunit SAP30 Sin3 binding domain-containing protein n=1 Tax=Helicocarpus griseus UAMH5409 TaxID=1447875 RepID=A0A2B7WGS6_9EURO|nr:hypothetical protein AJ79_09800 [Helicocarpus griseus UAMH5409]
MAPPRQRTAANLDDSRSEASSGAKERNPTGTKGRRPANAPAAGSALSSKDMKVAAATSSSGGPNTESAQSGESAGINWSSMPLSVLHQYRHAYKLPCPSAYSSQISSVILNQGIGLRSPTSIAARRAQIAARRKAADDGSGSRSAKKDDSASHADASGTGVSTRTLGEDNIDKGAVGMDLHSISTHRGQGRVTKDHLATAVRKHFNNVGLAEPDAIARFIYKVREEGKGHEFRLRFQP